MATYKVVDADKLDTDLKAVADSIRAKGGTAENLDFPADFVSAVGNIETGGEAKEEQEKTVDITENGTTEVFADEGKTMSKVTVNTNVAFEGDIGKPYIDTSKITDFRYFCYNGKLLDQIENIDTSNATKFERMFYSTYVDFNVSNLNTSKGTNFKEMFMSCSRVYEIGELNTDNGQQFDSMFEGCGFLITVKLTSIANATSAIRMFDGCESLENLDIEIFDTSKCTNISSMFHTCKKLKSIPFLDVSKCNYINDLFAGCFALETVSLSTAKTNFLTTSFYNCFALKNLTIGEGWAVNIYLNYSTELTVESLHGMIENLADLTGQTAKTFQIGATNLAKIDAEHLTMLQNKNWNYS